ncbi:MAG TPA: UDP-N-acetylmuramoyl-L-alanyl-D-glutamate--2,6-diaminopimelate ligase [Solirubrobacterales bacterium]|jgi:UDP-N-acetylmuramoyl-L-alanyl-D-glutamate--2,6-diaminopimelate ligase|nr:UDP-N-acetylmuramoyl-L-alanyl-D-glutamate--2,6-diaminopimelate ligase [Solirubrobacterales bacterium]
MRLDYLAAELDSARVVGDGSVEVADLAYDSRKAGLGTLFFCVPGEKVDGHDFAAQVIEAGAVALVVERELEVAVPQVVVADARAAMAPAAARFHGDPTAALRVVGVTGTNGKTTTAFLVREILEAAGISTGLLGTVKQVVGGTEESAERTTPEAIDLQATFRRMLDGGDRACAMEVSSHAMSLRRADAIHFEVALFTNLTQDHLDFHTDMEDYFGAKRRLLEAGPGTAVVNVDDPYGRRLAGEFDCVTFSAEGAGADYSARDVSFDASGAQFIVNRRSTGRKPTHIEGNRPTGGKVRVRTGLPGHFNVANALGAFAVAEALGVEAGTIARGLAAAARVPGRFEPIDEGQGFSVLVDYAHTPDSLENVLRAARRLTAGRVISVFGAGGDRDRDKRPKMGRAGAELSDLAVVTSDNPRSEDPETIVSEVVAGAGGGEVEVEVDRRLAIALALGRAEPGDTVVIAGKGHEQGQEFEEGRKIPFDDREVAREELRKLGSPA